MPPSLALFSAFSWVPTDFGPQPRLQSPLSLAARTMRSLGIIEAIGDPSWRVEGHRILMDSRPSFAVHFEMHFTYGGFLKWWYPTTMGFPTKMIILGCFGGPPFQETSISSHSLIRFMSVEMAGGTVVFFRCSSHDWVSLAVPNDSGEALQCLPTCPDGSKGMQGMPERSCQGIVANGPATTEQKPFQFFAAVDRAKKGQRMVKIFQFLSISSRLST